MGSNRMQGLSIYCIGVMGSNRRDIELVPGRMWGREGGGKGEAELEGQIHWIEHGVEREAKDRPKGLSFGSVGVVLMSQSVMGGWEAAG